MINRLLLAVALTCAACSPAAESSDEAGIAPPPGGWDGTIAASDYDPAKENALPRPPSPERDLADMVAGCNGMNPDTRPRGSNCFGLFPEQCGADLAGEHIGEKMTASLASRMSEYSVGGVRIIRPGQATNDDLRFARLNVFLDDEDRVDSVDCH